MSTAVRVLAVDLGATSVRVASIDLTDPHPQVEVVHRWQHAPVADAQGSLRWDWPGIVAQVKHGLELALAQGPVASIGVDGWAIDYALLDETGHRVADPYSYRDSRTEGWRRIGEAIGLERIYELSGIQLMGINTLFQLAVHDRQELDRAARLLLLPDLLVHELTGFEGSERSNASTTGLLDARSHEWSDELIEAVGVDRDLFSEVVAAGQPSGAWRDVPLHLVGSHDTASAFLGMPGGGDPGTVFVSTGTWVIVGMERPTADTSTEAREANFSNEAGAFGGVRFLKNVVGFWMLEQCRPGWGNPPVVDLLAEAEAIDQPAPIFDAQDERFLNPEHMEREIREAAGLKPDSPRGLVVRSILESIAAGIAAVIDELRSVSGMPISQVAIVGGGAQAGLLPHLIGAHTGLPVVIGSPEATALGNAVAQGIALGHFADLAGARQWLAATGRRQGREVL